MNKLQVKFLISAKIQKNIAESNDLDFSISRFNFIRNENILFDQLKSENFKVKRLFGKFDEKNTLMSILVVIFEFGIDFKKLMILDKFSLRNKNYFLKKILIIEKLNLQ